MKKIAVFCGSSTGNDEDYTTAAKLLGSTLIKNNFGLVFGGGMIGLMGVIARSVLENGGEVIGVIPEALYKKQLVILFLLSFTQQVRYRRRRHQAIIVVCVGHGDELPIERYVQLFRIRPGSFEKGMSTR